MSKLKQFGIRKIITWLNDSELDCLCWKNKNINTYDSASRLIQIGTVDRLPSIMGVTKDGKAIFIEYGSKRNKELFKTMRQLYEKTEHTGTAIDFWDCFDIIKGGKRKKRTFLFLEKKHANVERSTRS